jgi:hypothetical protein
VVQTLVSTLLDVFDASRDLYQTLRTKEKRDYEHSLRSRGYPSGRKFDYVEDEDTGGDKSLVMDKAAVTRQFEIGLQDVGTTFAVGDGMFGSRSRFGHAHAGVTIPELTNTSDYADSATVSNHRPTVGYNHHLSLRAYFT